MTVLEMNELPFITVNINRLMKHLESNCLPPFLTVEGDAAPAPIRQVFQAELRELMSEYRRRVDYIDAIPEGWMREIFTQRFIERRTFRQISTALGIPSNTLKIEVYAYITTHPEGYVSSRDLADAWGLNVNTINAWCRRELLPGAKKRRGFHSNGNQRWVIPADAVRPKNRRQR